MSFKIGLNVSHFLHRQAKTLSLPAMNKGFTQITVYTSDGLRARKDSALHFCYIFIGHRNRSTYTKSIRINKYFSKIIT